MNFPDSTYYDQSLEKSESKYYSLNSFNTQFNNSNTCSESNNKNDIKLDRDSSFSLLHMNARSLNKNFESMELLLHSLDYFPFSVIGISETWLHNNSPSIFNLQNYTMYRSDRQHNHGGGVALYAHNNINSKLRPDLSIDGSESMFLEIINENNKNTIVGVIYRPPKNCIDSFLDNFDQFLHKISEENKHVYLMGDYNIDLLAKNEIHSTKLITSLSSFAFYPHIDKPTRITNTCSS